MRESVFNGRFQYLGVDMRHEFRLTPSLLTTTGPKWSNLKAWLAVTAVFSAPSEGGGSASVVPAELEASVALISSSRVVLIFSSKVEYQ